VNLVHSRALEAQLIACGDEARVDAKRSAPGRRCREARSDGPVEHVKVTGA
jgi:hypothetical protein